MASPTLCILDEHALLCSVAVCSLEAHRGSTRVFRRTHHVIAVWT